MKPLRINKAIEVELVNFKKEIEEKFANSKMNREYFFPKKPLVRESEDLPHAEQDIPKENSDF